MNVDTKRRTARAHQTPEVRPRVTAVRSSGGAAVGPDCGEAAELAARVAGTLDLPRTCVVDVGRLPDGTWALIECNATWGAGLNGFDASSVIDCIAAASGAAVTQQGV